MTRPALLAELLRRFPWLNTEVEEVSGADVVDQLSDWYCELSSAEPPDIRCVNCDTRGEHMRALYEMHLASPETEVCCTLTGTGSHVTAATLLLPDNCKFPKECRASGNCENWMRHMVGCEAAPRK